MIFMKKIKNKKVYIGICIVFLVIVLLILSGTGVMSRIFSSKVKYTEGSTINYNGEAITDDSFIEITDATLGAKQCVDGICITINKISCNADRGKIEYTIENTNSVPDDFDDIIEDENGVDPEVNDSNLDPAYVPEDDESVVDDKSPSLSGYFEIVIGDNHLYGRYVDLVYGGTQTSYIRYVGINLTETTNYTFNLLGRESINHYIYPIDDISTGDDTAVDNEDIDIEEDDTEPPDLTEPPDSEPSPTS